MTHTPTVSVILTCFNGERYIAKAIQSVLDQTWRDFELIVVDDGSTDGTSAVVRAIPDPRLRYVRKENSGPGAARNTGIEAATGEWVAFLDCDDWWLATKLERQMDTARAARADFVCSGATLVTGDGGRMGDVPARIGEGALEMLLLGNHVPGGGSSALVRRSAINSVAGFDETVPLAEDWDCWLRLAARFPMASTPTCEVCKLVRPGSYGLQTDRLLGSGTMILDRAFTSYARHLGHLRRPALAALHYLAALDYNQIGNRAAERRALWALLGYRPFSLEIHRRLLRTFLPRGRARTAGASPR